jgi:hypothetical protein
LNESFPRVIFFLHLGLRRENEAVVVLETSHVVIVQKALSVEITHQLVLVDYLLVHYVFIRLHDDSNQEVEKDDEHDKLIEEPSHPDCVDENPFVFERVPICVCWLEDVTNRVFENKRSINDNWSNIRVAFVLSFVALICSKDSVE